MEGSYKQGDVSLNVVAEGEGKWRVQAKVANSMSCLVTKEGDKMVAGPVMSTRMMPPPDMQELESRISALLSGITNIVREGML